MSTEHNTEYLCVKSIKDYSLTYEVLNIISFIIMRFHTEGKQIMCQLCYWKPSGSCLVC